MTNCTVTNGTGVYFEEDGDAHIGAARLMITRFINHHPGVSFDGRYFDETVGRWRLLNGQGRIYNAKYQQRAVTIEAVSETETSPIWTMHHTGTTTAFSIRDAQLSELELYINFSVPADGNVPYVLDFVVAPSLDPEIAHPQLTMRWRLADAHESVPQRYCAKASGADDTVAFHAGIDVDPVDGRVTPAPDDVTMSCSLGAPEVAYRWGYDYTGGGSFHFAAAIHMKRASYCADEQYYTKAGVQIQVADSIPLNQPFVPSDVVLFEAEWTPTGARCLNPRGERRRDVVDAKGFKGRCNGVPLPPCVVGRMLAKPWLVDRKAPPSP